MFIQTEATPNPATLKFLPGRPVLPEGTAEFRDPADAGRSPLAERLFSVNGVSGVFLGHDFISVTKANGEWQHLKPALLGAIMEHFMAGVPVMVQAGPAQAAAGEAGAEFFEEADGEIVETIKELIETRVRPAVAQDGGDITFQGFRDGVVYLNMRGSCSGCPSSTATLKNGIQNLLRHFVPEVREVQSVN
ncbi:NifU family protein [Mesorhizobium sp. BR1-1-16]|uniref:NifU family protein n=1 Tax=Mesorhizobium sp. BR1-1-16 TaxID=2876653 RepID=UPI001CC9B056|nr:NifU family protein [Mesorhizobium sp. BR1-1-16]MBZ9938080.1 NifU family protein [Mesorhizobium sp. BR1-1-16]